MQTFSFRLVDCFLCGFLILENAVLQVQQKRGVCYHPETQNWILKLRILCRECRYCTCKHQYVIRKNCFAMGPAAEDKSLVIVLTVRLPNFFAAQRAFDQCDAGINNERREHE